MVRNANAIKYAALMLVVFFVCTAQTCGGKNVYETNVSIDNQVTTLMEQYADWYDAADQATQTRWKETIDPAMAQLDLLLSSYHNMIDLGQDTKIIISEITRIKTRIMIMLTKELEEN